MPTHSDEFPETQPTVPATPTTEQLRELAIAQRRVVLAVLFKLFIIPLMFLLVSIGQITPEGEPEKLGNTIVFAYYLIVTAFALFAIFKLGNIVSGEGIGCIYVFAMLFPLIGLIALLLLNGRATKLLRKYGVRVGLMGANLDTIDERMKQY